MSTKTDSQAQQTVDAFRKMAEEQVARANSFLEEGRKFEERWVQQASAAVDEMSRLNKAAIAWTVQITGEWRRLTTEALHRSTDLFVPRS